MRPFVLFSAVVALVAGACRRTSEPTPEDVVLRWQGYIDRNQYDSARLYSTELARSYIDFLDALAQGDSSETDETTLYDLRCDISGDSAVCHYLIEGEMGEKIPDTLILQKIGGRWLVHRVEGFLVIPVDSLQPGDEQILFQPDSLRNDSLDDELE